MQKVPNQTGVGLVDIKLVSGSPLLDGVLGPLLQMTVELMQPLAVTRSCCLNQIIVSRPRNVDEPLRLQCGFEQAATQFQRDDLVAVAVEKQQRRADVKQY